MREAGAQVVPSVEEQVEAILVDEGAMVAASIVLRDWRSLGWPLRSNNSSRSNSSNSNSSNNSPYWGSMGKSPSGGSECRAHSLPVCQV